MNGRLITPARQAARPGRALRLAQEENRAATLSVHRDGGYLWAVRMESRWETAAGIMRPLLPSLCFSSYFYDLK